MAQAINAGVFCWNKPTKVVSGCVAVLSVPAIIGGVVAAIFTSGVALKTALLVSGTATLVLDGLFVYLAKRSELKFQEAEIIMRLNLKSDLPIGPQNNPWFKGKTRFRVPKINIKKMIMRALYQDKNNFDSQEKSALRDLKDNWWNARQLNPTKDSWSISEISCAVCVTDQLANVPDFSLKLFLGKIGIPVNNGQILTKDIHKFAKLYKFI